MAFSQAADAGRLVLFHHEPNHADRALVELEERARELTADGREPPQLAREGMVIELS